MSNHTALSTQPTWGVHFLLPSPLPHPHPNPVGCKPNLVPPAASGSPHAPQHRPLHDRQHGRPRHAPPGPPRRLHPQHGPPRRPRHLIQQRLLQLPPVRPFARQLLERPIRPPRPSLEQPRRPSHDAPTFGTHLEDAGYGLHVFGKTDYRVGGHSLKARLTAWMRSANITTPAPKPSPSTPPPPRTIPPASPLLIPLLGERVGVRGLPLEDPTPSTAPLSPQNTQESTLNPGQDPARPHQGDWNQIDAACQFLNNHSADDPPYFLYPSTNVPHPPFRATQHLARQNRPRRRHPPALRVRPPSRHGLHERHQKHPRPLH